MIAPATPPESFSTLFATSLQSPQNPHHIFSHECHQSFAIHVQSTSNNCGHTVHIDRAQNSGHEGSRMSDFQLGSGPRNLQAHPARPPPPRYLSRHDANGTVLLTLPAGAVTDTVTVSFRSRLISLPAGWVSVGGFSVTATSSQGVEITQFAQPVTVSYWYDPVTLDSVPASSLRFAWQETAGSWVMMDTAVDATQHRAATTFTRSATVALLAPDGIGTPTPTPTATPTAPTSTATVSPNPGGAGLVFFPIIHRSQSQ